MRDISQMKMKIRRLKTHCAGYWASGGGTHCRGTGEMKDSTLFGARCHDFRPTQKEGTGRGFRWTALGSGVIV